MIQINLLYFDDCPSWQLALENLHKAIEAEHLSAEICVVNIESPEQAQQERFLGSPSFQVNGADLWPEQRDKYIMSCRVYPTHNGLKGSPSVEMLRERLREVIHLSEKAS